LYNLCSTRKLVPFLNGRQYILVLYAPDITNEFPSSLADIFPDCVIYCTIARSVSSSIHFRWVRQLRVRSLLTHLQWAYIVDCEWAFTSHQSQLALDVCQLACIHTFCCALMRCRPSNNALLLAAAATSRIEWPAAAINLKPKVYCQSIATAAEPDGLLLWSRQISTSFSLSLSSSTPFSNTYIQGSSTSRAHRTMSIVYKKPELRVGREKSVTWVLCLMCARLPSKRRLRWRYRRKKNPKNRRAAKPGKWTRGGCAPRHRVIGPEDGLCKSDGRGKGGNIVKGGWTSLDTTTTTLATVLHERMAGATGRIHTVTNWMPMYLNVHYTHTHTVLHTAYILFFFLSPFIFLFYFRASSGENL
jgi:hypothetical protein